MYTYIHALPLFSLQMHTIPPTLGVLCPIPVPPLDGEVSWNSNEVGAVLHYYCREGFDLVGTASQECLPIGEWSSYTPLCMKGESVGEGMHACEMQPPPTILRGCVCEVWFNTHIAKVAWDSPIHGLCAGENPIHKSLLGSIADSVMFRLLRYHITLLHSDVWLPCQWQCQSPFDQLSKI